MRLGRRGSNPDCLRINGKINHIIYIYFEMSERKSWTKMEDHILKTLYEHRGYKKWSEVAEIMRTEYGILGRNGKQCRERYHNHLDQSITKAEWTPQEDQILLNLHNELGNRWALIAREIKGRTDNCVKNRFYSRFRRSIRNVNDMIKSYWRKKFKQLKPALITKIIEISEEYRQNPTENRHQVFTVCQSLKSRLMLFSDLNESFKQNQEAIQNLFQLIKEINDFNRSYKRRAPKKRREEWEQNDDDNSCIEKQKSITEGCTRRKKKVETPDQIQIKEEREAQIEKQDMEIYEQTIKLDNGQNYPQLELDLPLMLMPSDRICMKDLKQDQSQPLHSLDFFEQYIEDVIQDQVIQGFDVFQFYEEENLEYFS